MKKMISSSKWYDWKMTFPLSFWAEFSIILRLNILSRCGWNQFLSNLAYRCKLHHVILQPFLIHQNGLKLNLKLQLRMGDFVTVFQCNWATKHVRELNVFRAWNDFYIFSWDILCACSRQNRFKFNKHNFVFIKTRIHTCHKIVYKYVAQNWCFCIFKIKMLFV